MSKPLPPAHPDQAIVWMEDELWLLDQRVLPVTETYLHCPDAGATAKAITNMVVRGAPAIGVTAAYGVVLAARDAWREAGDAWSAAIQPDLGLLAASRPTAVNLFWALQRMQEFMQGLPAGNPIPALLAEAQRMHLEDAEANRRLGDLGAELIEGPTSVITHCNTGGLATGGYGTALGVIRSAWSAGKVERVYADETRPWLQGLRLTAWELVQAEIPVSVIVDGAAAARMRAGGISWCIVGADRIAANGDAANKIGTYQLAVAARHHGVKFMVAAPTSTIDFHIPDGNAIPIEERDPNEVLQVRGEQLGPDGADAWNPVFDVTPAELIDAIVTEKGVVLNPTAGKMADLRG